MKRTVFRNPWLPYLLVVPQVVVTLVFFFWPAGKSLYLSLFKSPPFGGRDVFVGLDNFTTLLRSPEYYDSVINSFVFAGGVTGLSVVGALVVSALANQKIRGLPFYRTALLWPYGIAPRWPGSSSSSSSIRPTACCPTTSPSSPPTSSTGCSGAGSPWCW